MKIFKEKMMTRAFKKFLTESEIKLDPNMRVGDKLVFNINAKDVVEMEITEVSENKITVKAGLQPDGSYITHDEEAMEFDDYEADEEEKVDEEMKWHYSAAVSSTRPAMNQPGLEQHKEAADWHREKLESSKDYTDKKFHTDRMKHHLSQAKAKDEPVDEAAKPDYLDFDKDGDEDEPMKKALKDKEQVDELSKNKLGQYVNKASNDAAMKAHQYGIDKERSDEIDRYTNRSGMKDQFKARDTMKKELGIDDMHKNWNKAGKRIKGINQAVSKLTREQVDQIEVTESNGNLFAAILRNAGLKTVTESDLNTKVNEKCEQGVAEEIIGQPEFDHTGNAGRGSYGAAEYTATTKHRLGSHVYEVTTEQDGDGDFSDFIYENGKEIFSSIQPSNRNQLGHRISSALLDKHKKATAHFFDSEDDDEANQGVAEDAILRRLRRNHKETSLKDIRELSGLQTVNESPNTIEDIIDNYPEEVKKFENNDMSYDFEDILHDFYANNGEMPRHLVGDDAGNWITDQFEKDLNYYLNNKTSEENQIDEISANLVSRAAKQADRNAYDADKAGAYKAQEIHTAQADRLYAKAKEKEEKEEREGAKANELRGLSGVKTRALNKKFYNAEGASKKNTFELSEGKIVYMGETYDLTLNNNKRTWTANIWTTRKIR